MDNLDPDNNATHKEILDTCGETDIGCIVDGLAFGPDGAKDYKIFAPGKLPHENILFF